LNVFLVAVCIDCDAQFDDPILPVILRQLLLGLKPIISSADQLRSNEIVPLHEIVMVLVGEDA
jgi:hypothetical protein